MGIIRKAWWSNKMSFARAATLSEKDAQALHETAEAFDSPIYTLQPYHGENGVEEAVDLLGGLYHYQTKLGLINNSESHVFEMWFDGERTKFCYIPENITTGESFREQMSEDYPNSNVRQSTEKYPTNNGEEKPDMFEPGRAIAGARFDLMKNPIFPIKNLDNGGFGTRSRGPTRDPYKDLIGPFTREEDCRCIYQLVFYPKQRGRFRQIRATHTAKNLRGQHAFLLDTRDATKDEKEAANTIEEQKSRDIFAVEMRVLVSAPTKQMANDRLSDLTNQIGNRYRTNQNQRLYAEPASSYVPGMNGRTAKQFGSTVLGREAEKRTNIECTPEELAGLAHLPSDDVQNQHVDWTSTKAGDPVPMGTPRFDWSGHDLDRMELTPHQEQEALMLKSGPGDPYWLGQGARKNTEAGVLPDVLKRHMFVGGATGFGKTTLLKNFFTQAIRRGTGALFYDPKADDARDFVSMVPEDRRDDLIYIEVGGDREQTVGFNFLEIPGDPDPESARMAEAVESMADDIEALVAQAGGSDEYWGPRMSRVVRNMARGMAKSGRNLTLLDMYYALIDEQGRQEYAQHLSDERIEWIVDYAARQLADMDDSDIEPLIGRLQQWVESDLMRSIVSHPESTFSVEQAVAEGKIIIVRDMTSTGGTAGQLIATALIRRIWSAVQNLDDPPMFYAILDEFDKVVSGQSSLAEILSLARSANLSIVPACQDLSNQLAGEEEIKNAILGQCQTFVNFNPQRQGEAKEMVTRHSEEVSAADLTNLPNFQFYFRTENERKELTYSYKVNSFPPIEEIVEEEAATEEEVDAMIENSLERYATQRMTSEQIRESSEFRAGGSPEEMAEAADAGKDEDTQRRDEMFAAVDRAQIRSEKVGEFVHHERVREAWETIASEDLGYLSQTANLIEESDDAYLEKQRRNGEVHARLTPAGREVAGLVQDTGSSGSGGGLDHRWVLSQSKLAYERMGYTVTLPTQGEGDGELPDGVGLMPVDPTSADNLSEMHDLESKLKTDFNEVYEYSGGRDISIEAETSTITKPMQTMTNLRKAMDVGMKCVFTTKDGSYNEAEIEDPENVPDHSSVFEYWARRGERIMYDDDLEDLIFARERNDDGELWYYNQSNDFMIDERREFVALRPARKGSETVWRDDGDEIVLADDSGEIYARFGGAKDLADPPVEAFPAYYEYDTDGEGQYHVQAGGEQQVFRTKDEMKAEWTPVVEPFIPDIEFTDENGEPNTPTAEDFEFVIFPDGNNEQYDEPMVYKHGEVVGPLLPEDMRMPSSVVSRDPDEVEASEADEASEASEPSEGTPASESTEASESPEEATDSTGDTDSESSPDSVSAESTENSTGSEDAEATESSQPTTDNMGSESSEDSLGSNEPSADETGTEATATDGSGGDVDEQGRDDPEATEASEDTTPTEESEDTQADSGSEGATISEPATTDESSEDSTQDEVSEDTTQGEDTTGNEDANDARDTDEESTDEGGKTFDLYPSDEDADTESGTGD
ncbi:type IV secretion system DNA-binding domain-containing protein [Halococcus sp. IIIV-5B]|uniref:type IV secretion system DNA-binding domain-containing protein n=1 Tax=Halococcus sp. IIIV-5B TaxID=2321230 RepID=UPI000E76EC4A|nr:type IV secretion system DNA-binding domain-containing protein [Halococcus sp. IIIV-5B]RJT04725.1 hypothetical protein D3261_08940 [Halococcus sp. IIIV-5B]